MRPDDLDAAWNAYLDRLALHSENVVPDQVFAARKLWDAVRAKWPGFPVPRAGTHDDGTLQLAWDAGEHHVDIDILSGLGVDWFYKNRRTGELDGGESDSAVPLPAELERCLSRMVQR